MNAADGFGPVVPRKFPRLQAVASPPMEPTAEEWVGALMMAVAVAEQVAAIGEGASGPNAEAVRSAAVSLRDEATRELERKRVPPHDGVRPVG